MKTNFFSTLINLSTQSDWDIVIKQINESNRFAVSVSMRKSVYKG